MDKRMKDLVDFIRDKYGLKKYFLHTYQIRSNTTIFNETVYTLDMEWFPDHEKDWQDEDFNPEGTAYIEMDIHSKEVFTVIFTGGRSYANKKFSFNDRDEIIKWIEKETGLKYQQQFHFWKEEEGKIHFKECINGVAVSPSGSIEVKFDDAGKLTQLFVCGQFPDESLVIQEKYKLSINLIEGMAKEQLKLAEFPSMEKKKLVPAYAMEEIYIKNDLSGTLNFEFIVDAKSRLPIDEVMEWENSSQKSFQRKELSLVENMAPEQAFSKEPHPDLKPITESESKMCLESIKLLLSGEFPEDSGNWILKSLHREKGYIHAVLKVKEQEERVFHRKLLLFIDPQTYEVLNYMDNKSLLEIYKDFQAADLVKVTKEESYDKLKNLIELSPYYVYDFEQEKYVLCGKLDSQYAVIASNGDVVNLSEL
ncbi:hypothetical protein LC048_10730 [Mesobacillus subterraneus]|uniref:hypothetical protein n=1 Tax=Mesobacillus subterraneus TaxID=285983 RepID=UPI001CFD1B5D|nr:hypothetical protein [Mesobacillus subterraneus]WLR57286.1 hypothetical protein LC048_10730 [Mesobacillus subterraneus]